MLYATLNQPIVFFVLLLIGFSAGVIFDAIKLLNYFFNHNNISKQIFLFLCILAVFAIFSEVNLTLNFGEIRFYSFLAFFGGITLQRFTIGILFAKVTQKCYNQIVKLWQKVKRFSNGRKKKENH